MDIYTRIKNDHNRHRHLAESLLETSGDTDERKRLWQILKEDVEAHANAEEQSLYAALIATNEGQEKSQHSIAEHKELNDLIAKVDDSDMSSSAWLQHFKSFQHELEHHMVEEERDVFPLARRILSDDEASALVDRFETRKQLQ